MEEKKPISHIAAGLLISAAVILYSVVMNFTAGGSSDPKGGWVSYLIIIIGLLVFINLYAKAKNYQVTFGDLFSYGFKATTMIVLLSVVFMIVLSFVMPEIKTKVMEATRLEMEKQKNITDAEIDSMIQSVNKFFWVILIGTSMFFFVLIGAIGSLIGAAVTKKLPKNPFEQTSF